MRNTKVTLIFEKSKSDDKPCVAIFEEDGCYIFTKAVYYNDIAEAYYDLIFDDKRLDEIINDARQEGKKQANIDHNIECADCVRLITAADEERIRADERMKFAEWFAKCSKVSEPVLEHTVTRWIEDYEKEQKDE